MGVTEDSRKFHNEELHNSYPLPNITRMIETRRVGWERHAAHTGKTSKMYTKHWQKVEKPLRRIRGKWEDNIEMNLQDWRIGGCGLDSFGSRQESVAGSCE
jgi:hypothetical protein